MDVKENDNSYMEVSYLKQSNPVRGFRRANTEDNYQICFDIYSLVNFDAEYVDYPNLGPEKLTSN